jgi:hypothetical protein
MKGQIEDIVISDDGKTAVVNRGDAGAAVINFSLDQVEVEAQTSLPDGSYADVAYGTQFAVVGGILKGKVLPETTYILIAE